MWYSRHCLMAWAFFLHLRLRVPCLRDMTCCLAERVRIETVARSAPRCWQPYHHRKLLGGNERRTCFKFLAQFYQSAVYNESSGHSSFRRGYSRGWKMDEYGKSWWIILLRETLVPRSRLATATRSSRHNSITGGGVSAYLDIIYGFRRGRNCTTQRWCFCI